MTSQRSPNEPVTADGELLRQIKITQVLDCLADPNKIRVMAKFSENVREALPYVATALPQAGYNHAAGMLTMMIQGRLLTVYPHVATLAKALDEDDARSVLEWLRGQINEAYARRNELEACLGRRRSPRILNVYQLLPKSNCQRCGEPSCMAFAARLIFAEARLGDCPALMEPGFARNRSLLSEWLGQAD